MFNNGVTETFELVCCACISALSIDYCNSEQTSEASKDFRLLCWSTVPRDRLSEPYPKGATHVRAKPVLFFSPGVFPPQTTELAPKSQLMSGTAWLPYT